jgi:pimeloyl-ACP methyl ester carboxylesterase
VCCYNQGEFGSGVLIKELRMARYRGKTFFSRLGLLHLVIVSVVAILLLTPNNCCLGQESKAETWMGILKAGPQKLRIELRLKPEKNGSFSGAMVSLDQVATPIPFDSVERTSKQLSFEIKKLGVSFAGDMNADQSVVTGVFTQGLKFNIEFKRVDGWKPAKHVATWVGKMEAGPKHFDFQFRVFVNFEGKKSIQLDSLTEGINGLEGGFEQEGNQITMTIPATAAKVIGKLDAAGNVIGGTWIQSGAKIPLVLKRIPIEQTKSPKLNRPQTPKPPFDYDAEDFTVQAAAIDPKYSNDVVLAGTLTAPAGKGPFPTVILTSGSGPQDRDETIFEHRPFLVIADYLTKKGFAVIRYDDRGIGQSKGDFLEATTADLADDLEVVFEWAKKSPKIDSKKIILAGHSEGGIIGPIVASRNADVAGVVLLAGTGVIGREIVLNQTREIAAVAGLPEKVLDLQDKLLRLVVARSKAGLPMGEDFADSLNDVFGDLSEEERLKYGLNEVATKTILMFKSKWMRYFLEFDPATTLSKTHCPVLSLIGGNDLQVDPQLNMPAIKTAMDEAGNQDFTQVLVPGLNHLFQKSETGSPSNYVIIEQTLDDSLLSELSGWLEARFK